jgi:hypothetical protein
MFGQDQGVPFYLITSPALAAHLTVECERHVAAGVLILEADDALQRVIATVPENSHILVVSPDSFISSLSPDAIGRRKVGVLAANSTPCPPDAVAHFLAAAEATDAAQQVVWSRAFFEALNATEWLSIRNDDHGVEATFAFRDPGNKWFFQGGHLGWGQQQIVPSGEISVLPTSHGKFDVTRRLKIDGEIALTGYAILHSGRPSFLREDQQRLYEALQPLEHGAVICTVRDGVIRATRASSPIVEDSRRHLEAMFMVDSRYRLIWELGLGINRELPRLPGNYAMNETYGGSSGILHWGLGLTPYTQYHLDVLSPGTTIVDQSGRELLEGRESKGTGTIVPFIHTACPCLDG